MHNLYGPTEAAVDVTSWECVREGGPAVVPIGRPIANMVAYVLDAGLQPTPIGVGVMQATQFVSVAQPRAAAAGQKTQ